MTLEESSDFERYLAAVLSGRECRKTTSCLYTGRAVSLNFGDEVHSYRSTRDGQLRVTYQSGLLVQSAWRVELGDTVICSSEDDPDKGGPWRRVCATLSAAG